MPDNLTDLDEELARKEREFEALQELQPGECIAHSPDRFEAALALIGKRVLAAKEVRHSEMETTSNPSLHKGFVDNHVILYLDDGTEVKI